MPRGRIIEIFGPESSGKTTLVYHIIAEAQKLGGVCAFVDAEHAMDPLYAQQIGVDIDELLVSQPDYGEQALEIVDMLIRSGAVDVIAVDSVAALTPRAELEGQMGDQTVGVQARMMSQAMRKLAGNLNRTQTLCVFTNQIREKVGVMFGSPETQPGGRALKFYASQRLDIRRIETLKDGTEAVGNRVRVKVVKNKVAAPFKQAEFDIEFGKGISTSGCLIDYGIEHNIVTKSGSFFSYGEERLGQGRGNAKAFLDEHPEMAQEIEEKIYAALGIGRDLVKPIEPREETPARRRSIRQPVGGQILGSVEDRPMHEHRRSVSSTRWALAYRYLNRRERTVAEVGAACSARSSPPATIEAAIATLVEQGYRRRRAASRGCSRRTSASSSNGEAIGSAGRCSSAGIDRELIEDDARRERRARAPSSSRRARAAAPALSRPAARPPRARSRARGAAAQGLRQRAGARRADAPCTGPGICRRADGRSESSRPPRGLRRRCPQYYDAGSERMARGPQNTSKFRRSWIPDFSVDGNFHRVIQTHARPLRPHRQLAAVLNGDLTRRPPGILRATRTGRSVASQNRSSEAGPACAGPAGEERPWKSSVPQR